jgi:hypothetical protein
VPVTAAWTPEGLRGVFEFCRKDSGGPAHRIQNCSIQLVNATGQGERDFLLPITQLHASAAAPITWIGYEVNSLPSDKKHSESVRDCVMAYPTATAARGACLGYGLFMKTEADSMESDYVAADLPILFMRMLLPIVLSSIVGDETSAPRVVGFIAGYIRMDEVLASLVPEFVDDVDFVINWGSETYTYTLSDGKAINLRVGDQHDKKHTSLGKHKEMVLGILGIASQLSIYPSHHYFGHAQKELLFVSLGVAGMILLCSMIFLLYDLAVSRASTGQTAALDTKRRFVRFISHEVRTPLNSVRLGMDIFTGELATFLKRLEAVPPAQLLQEVQTALLNWIDLAADVQVTLT